MIRRMAAAGAVAVALGACAGDPEPHPGLAEAAAPLVEAHDRLEAHAAAFAADPDAAHAAWPELAGDITEALAAVEAADDDGLAPRDRSTLVGYARGLEVARDAWDDVHEAVADGDGEAADRAAAGARERMRHLERLRDGVSP